MYRSREPLPQGPLNTGKICKSPRPREQKDKTTLAGVPKGIPRT